MFVKRCPMGWYCPFSGNGSDVACMEASDATSSIFHFCGNSHFAVFYIVSRAIAQMIDRERNARGNARVVTLNVYLHSRVLFGTDEIYVNLRN